MQVSISAGATIIVSQLIYNANNIGQLYEEFRRTSSRGTLFGSSQQRARSSALISASILSLSFLFFVFYDLALTGDWHISLSKDLISVLHSAISHLSAGTFLAPVTTGLTHGGKELYTAPPPLLGSIIMNRKSSDLSDKVGRQ